VRVHTVQRSPGISPNAVMAVASPLQFEKPNLCPLDLRTYVGVRFDARVTRTSASRGLSSLTTSRSCDLVEVIDHQAMHARSDGVLDLFHGLVIAVHDDSLRPARQSAARYRVAAGRHVNAQTLFVRQTGIAPQRKLFEAKATPSSKTLGFATSRAQRLRRRRTCVPR